VHDTGAVLGSGSQPPHQFRTRNDLIKTPTNATESKRKHSKINEADHYPVAHNGLVAGSSPAGPTTSLVRQRSPRRVLVR